jgi:tetratricopeptide (TPR) repeat protein
MDVALWSAGDLEAALDTFRDVVELAQRAGRRPFVRYGNVRLDTRELAGWLGLTEDERARGDATRVLKRAAVLHTDIAILEERSPATSRSAPPGSTGSVTVHDGRFAGYQFTSGHWAFTRRLLDLVRPAPSTDPAVRDWYRAVAAFHVDRLNYGELGTHVERGRSLLRDDAVLVMMAGVKHQTFASSRVQTSLASVVLPPRTVLGIGSRERELLAARHAFRDALKLDPRLVEARVRLGRVLAEEGHAAEAAGHLRAALDAADEPVLRYLAALFLGEQEAKLGRSAEAAAALAVAISVEPGAPSPHLALSQLARARGDRADAQQSLDRALTLAGRRTARDPWWSFLESAGRHWESWLDDARRALAGEDRQ